MVHRLRSWHEVQCPRLCCLTLKPYLLIAHRISAPGRLPEDAVKTSVQAL